MEESVNDLVSGVPAVRKANPWGCLAIMSVGVAFGIGFLKLNDTLIFDTLVGGPGSLYVPATGIPVVNYLTPIAYPCLRHRVQISSRSDKV
jgi:hypothetical protein